MDLFYQFYDLLVIAVTAVVIYVSVKKGISKTFPEIIGYVMSFFIALRFSGPVSDYIYSGFFKERNINTIFERISEIDFSRQYKSYIDTLGYGFTADSGELEKIFRSGENITEKTYQYFNSIEKDFDRQISFSEKFKKGYYSILFDSLKSDMPSLSYEKSVLSEKQFDESVKMMYNDDIMLNARYIEEHFTSEDTVSLMKKLSAVFIIIVFMIFFRMISDRLVTNIKGFGIVDHTLGIIYGLIQTAVFMIIISEIAEILVNIGNDEMILFNTQTIEKTRIFKHIYYIIINSTID